MIGVVIPARNEAATVGFVVSRTLRALPDATVVVVDDASSDGTGPTASAAGATVVTHERPLGYGESLRAGYRALLRRDVRHIVQLDADGQHTPEDLPVLLAALDRHDVVIGSRFLGDGYRMSLARRGAIEALRLLARRYGVSVTDPTSGIRALRAPVADAVAVHGFPDGLTESGFLVWLSRRGFEIGEVPVTMRPSLNGSMHDGIGGVTHFVRVVRSTIGLAARRPSR